jgi:hypothetical protein
MNKMCLLEHLLKRIHEYQLGLKPDQLNEENIWEFARMAEAIRRGGNLKTYTSKAFLNYDWDNLGLITQLEQALDIEIKDEQFDSIKTFADIISKTAISNLDFKDLEIHTEYYDLLLKSEKIKILIVGRDPYPIDAMGIPFCKVDMSSLQDKRSSGYHVLNSLGINLTDGREPIQIFYDLLNDDKIGFVNACYFLPKQHTERYKIKFSTLLNLPIYKKADSVVLTESARKFLIKKDKTLPSKYVPIENLEIQNPIKEDWIKVCHPAARNKGTDNYTKIWGENNLEKYVNGCKANPVQSK